MGTYKGINQKGLAFHAEAKQKNYKENNKLRKLKLPSFSMLVSFYRLFCSPRILGKSFPLSIKKNLFCRRFASNSVSGIL